jgi:predicted ABC-type ATPase
VSADPLATVVAALGAQPVLILLAGPNGAGKTTFFEHYLGHLGLPYVNADRMALALRAADPTAPGDVIDRRAFAETEKLRAAMVEARMSFCTETVFSDPVGAKLTLLARARTEGFAVFLVFIGLQNPALSVARVKQRVEHGGHDVPDEKLQARFPRTLANLRAAIPVVDEAFVLDNSSWDAPYRVVAVHRAGTLVSRHPPFPSWTRGLPGL